MTAKQAKKFTNKIFAQIKEAKTISDLDAILDNKQNFSENNRRDILSYPKIEFSIKKKEIQSLIKDKTLDNNLNFSANITKNITDPLTKLLYATAWKNGDLKKIKHIIKGINGNSNKQDKALVFYQFGKYLTKKSGQPIIDQHVIRAFAVYQTTENHRIEKLQKLKTLNKTHKKLIDDYISWLQGKDLTEEIKSIADYSHYIDKLLFATGKTIKFKNPSTE